MPSLKNAFASRDANIGHGYGRLVQKKNSASLKSQSYPYSLKTQIEKLVDDADDSDVESAITMRKKLNQVQAMNDPSALNYRSHAFVNGSTRGLTGIMDSVDLLKTFITNVICEKSESIFGIKPIGTGAPNPDTMSVDVTTRTRHGRFFGSKKGWFSNHQPKETDPEYFDLSISIDDLFDDDERAIKRNILRNTNINLK